MSNILGVASKYNIFTLDDLTMSNTDCEGRVAVGGSAILNDYSIGGSILPLPPFGTDKTFVVRGNIIDVSGGTNYAGNTIVDEDTVVSEYTMNNLNGALIEGTPIDFISARIYLQCLAVKLSTANPTNGEISVVDGTLYLTGQYTDLNVFNFINFNVDDSSLNLGTFNGINIIVPEGSTVLIIVHGINIAFGSYQIFVNGDPATTEQAKKILWVFPECLAWTNNNTAIYGSVLAPFATANTIYSQINGNVIFRNLLGNAELHNHLFNGEIDPVNCETSTTTASTTTCTESSSSTRTRSTPCTHSTTRTHSTSRTYSTTKTYSTTRTHSTTCTRSTTMTSATTPITISTTTTVAPDVCDSVANVINSIAKEEEGLSFIMFAESQKICKALKITNSIDDLIDINTSVKKTLDSIIKSQILLNMKLDNTGEILCKCNCCPCDCNGQSNHK